MTTYRVPYTFVPGTKAKATEVNANFSSVVDLIEETATNALDRNLSNLSVTGKNVIYNSSQSKMIGEIVTSTIPLSDSGLHLLDGSVIYGNGIYSDFVSYIAGLISEYPNMFCSEDTWQASVTNYGTCGKFVYNVADNTVRLPKITGILEGTNDTEMTGDLIEAGLPNIEGSIYVGRAYIPGTASGALYKSGSATEYIGADGQTTGGSIGIDASLSNSAYGKSETVQPQAIKVLYYIVIATVQKSETIANIDNITTELNMKANKDLSNAVFSSTVKENISLLGKPNYSLDYRITVNAGATTTEGTYTVPSNGWLDIYWLMGSVTNSSGCYIKVNNINILTAWTTSPTTYNGDISCLIPVSKGDVITYKNGTSTSSMVGVLYFFPDKINQ